MKLTFKAKDIMFYKNRPVVTTSMLAEFYETTPHRIRENFSRNADRFVDGKHFFRIEGEELKNFHLSVSLSYAQIGSKARSFTLWTVRGSARHAKMLNTNKAWDVFEILEDSYFDKGAREDYRRARRAEKRTELEWQQLRAQGKITRRQSTDYFKEFVEWAEKNGSENANQYFNLFTKLVYNTVFDNYKFNAKLPKGFRDQLDSTSLRRVECMEKIVGDIIHSKVRQGMPYKEIYTDVKAKLEVIVEQIGTLSPNALAPPE